VLVDFVGSKISTINVSTIPCEIERRIARTAEAVAYGGGKARVLVDFNGM